jgi:hypothetical protein
MDPLLELRSPAEPARGLRADTEMAAVRATDESQA